MDIWNKNMRPKIICHMMSSVDGRLIGDRWSIPFDGKNRELLYEPYNETGSKFEAQAWMIGRNTVQQDFKTGIFNYEDYPPAQEFKTFTGKRNSRETCIVMDSKGKTRYEEDSLSGDNVIAVLGETVSEQYLSHLREKGISYLFAGADGGDIVTAVETIRKEFGITKILLEGGGILNGAFLKAGLIDELSLLMYPGVDGLSGISSIIEYKGAGTMFPAQGQTLELLSAEILADGIVWIRYKFHKIKQTQISYEK
jgi:riboflavin biosynthesis pyrimidine reductase